jgi:predicted nucleic-acid-binding Zn-ribbon protein
MAIERDDPKRSDLGRVLDAAFPANRRSEGLDPTLEPGPSAEAVEAAKREKDRLAQIVAALAAKGVSKECPRCHTQNWGVQDLDLVVSNPDSKGFSILPTVIQSIVLVCSNCGYLAFHSRKNLGLDK